MLDTLAQWIRKLAARKLRLVRIPDHVRIVGATIYVPDGMCLELGNYVILEGCIVLYGEALPPGKSTWELQGAALDITPEQGEP